MSKRMVIALLLCLNLGLLAGLVWTIVPSATAVAQEAWDEDSDAPSGAAGDRRAAGGGDMVIIAAQADAGNDVIYVFDKRTMILHALRTPFPRVSNQPVGIVQVDARDISGDFGPGRRRAGR